MCEEEQINFKLSDICRQYRYIDEPLRDIGLLRDEYEKYFLRDNELVVLLNEFAKWAGTRADVMGLPISSCKIRGMQRRGRYDHVNVLLCNSFGGGSKAKFFQD